jgi:hypothetical protein
MLARSLSIVQATHSAVRLHRHLLTRHIAAVSATPAPRFPSSSSRLVASSSSDGARQQQHPPKKQQQQQQQQQRRRVGGAAARETEETETMSTVTYITAAQAREIDEKLMGPTYGTGAVHVERC